MKKLVFGLVLIMLLSVSAAFAQDMFKDVPSDHWAYDAVGKLKAEGLVEGYPGDIYLGKRSMNRYEFAMVISRLLNYINDKTGATPVVEGKGVTQADLDNAIKGLNFASKADIDAAIAKNGEEIKKMADEFRKELEALGVRVSDAEAKINDLEARMQAVEKELARVKWNGTVNGIARVSNNTSKNGTVVDKDNRGANNTDNMFRSMAFLTDVDLSVSGKVSDSTNAYALINFGNYLNYLGVVNNYNMGGITGAYNDNFFPYYAFINTQASFGKLTVGRQPLKLTPYTLQKVDVDSYTTNAKTDDGAYPLDGFTLNSSYGGVGVTAFVGKTDNNTYVNDITSILPSGSVFFDSLNDASINAYLANGVTQTAGVRATVPTPLDGKAGLTYYSAWSKATWLANLKSRNQAEVMAFDLSMPLPISGISLNGTVAKSNVKGGEGVSKLDFRNGAYDVKLNGEFSGIGLGVGYKRIGENYIAAGDWGKIGRWANPRMIEGFYADAGYTLTDAINIKLGAEMYKFTDNKTILGSGTILKDDKIDKYAGEVNWKFSDSNAFGLGFEWIKYGWNRPKGFKGDDPSERYITLNWNHKLNEDAAIKIGYQLIGYDRGYGVYSSRHGQFLIQQIILADWALFS